MAKTVLLADDSSTIRKIVELALSEAGYRVESAGGGAEAMELLQRVRPDLVLADVVMPQPDGYAICRAIKTSERPVPVLLLAGTFEPFDPERARRAGADDHLVKPFESDVLREKVGALLRGIARAPVPPPPAAGLAVTSVEPAADRPPAPRLHPDDVDAIAQTVLERLTSDVVRDVVREMLPRIAEDVVRERLRQLEALETTEGD